MISASAFQFNSCSRSGALITAGLVALLVSTEASAQTASSELATPDSAQLVQDTIFTTNLQGMRNGSAVTIRTVDWDTVNRSRVKQAGEGAVIGLTLGALAGGIVTILGDESGNLGWNIFLLSIPGAVVGGILGLAL